jgi:hypothetical protein
MNVPQSQSEVVVVATSNHGSFTVNNVISQ